MQEKVYRNLLSPIYVLGLELPDLLGLVIIFLVLFNISDAVALNIVLLTFAYAAIRWFKKGKPPGFAIHLVKFVCKSEKFSVHLRDSLPVFPDKDER